MCLLIDVKQIYAPTQSYLADIIVNPLGNLLRKYHITNMTSSSYRFDWPASLTDH